jgi:hypothetical protein
MSRIRDALEAHAAENEGQYPWTLDEILPRIEQRSVPLDAWKNEYFYVPPLDTGVFVLFSFGADTQPGGKGFDADLELHPEAREPHLVRECPRPPARGPLWARR